MLGCYILCPCLCIAYVRPLFFSYDNKCREHKTTLYEFQRCWFFLVFVMCETVRFLTMFSVKQFVVGHTILLFLFVIETLLSGRRVFFLLLFLVFSKMYIMILEALFLNGLFDEPRRIKVPWNQVSIQKQHTFSIIC